MWYFALELKKKKKKGKSVFNEVGKTCISDYLVYCVYVCKLKDALSSGLKKEKKHKKNKQKQQKKQRGSWVSTLASFQNSGMDF